VLLFHLLTTISTRKWKAKLKDWGLDKYSKADEMAFIASKSQSRKSEGKDTTFFLGDKEITNETIERLMKRTHMNAEEILSPTAGLSLLFFWKISSN
jgi:hypothetical protein